MKNELQKRKKNTLRFDVLSMLYKGFTLLHSIQDRGETNYLSIQCHLLKYKWIYCVIETMLKLMFIEIA